MHSGTSQNTSGADVEFRFVSKIGADFLDILEGLSAYATFMLIGTIHKILRLPALAHHRKLVLLNIY